MPRLAMPRLPKTAWLLAAASGGLQVLVFPTPGLYWLGWVALVPLVVAVLAPGRFGTAAEQRPATLAGGFWLGYLAGVLWYAGTCYWVFYVMNVYGGLAAPVALGLLILFCLYLGLYHGVFALLLAWTAQRSRGLGVPLLLAPFYWVTLELARARISGFPWNLLGTSQVENIPLSGIATVTGVYGISFELALLNVAFAAAVLLPRPRRRPMLAAALGAAVLLQAGALVKPQPAVPTHSATLVQQNLPILEPGAWTVEFFDQTVQDLVRHSLPPAGAFAGEPRLIVWPESPAPFFSSDPRFREEVSRLARATNAYVIAGNLGLNDHDHSGHEHGGHENGAHAAHDAAPPSSAGAPAERPEPAVYNSAALVAPTGEWTARYDKIHLVPFGEYMPARRLLFFADTLVRQAGQFERGRHRTPFQVDGRTVGVFICYESIFPHEVREFALNGAQVFVNISNDGWFGRSGAPGQHLNMARMRAVENRRWILRSTNTGITASIDPYGRMVAVAERERRTALQAPYAFAHAATFYTRYGDWFAFACAIITVAALLAVRFRAGKV